MTHVVTVQYTGGTSLLCELDNHLFYLLRGKTRQDLPSLVREKIGFKYLIVVTITIICISIYSGGANKSFLS